MFEKEYEPIVRRNVETKSFIYRIRHSSDAGRHGYFFLIILQNQKYRC